MQTLPFGKTGMTASVAGLGCGGYSRLGQGNGMPPEHSLSIIRKAIDLGVRFIDTSPSYENEALVGEAIAPVRDQVILSTKFSTLNREDAAIDGPAVRQSLEASLRRLGTDHVDVYSIQSVTPATYDHVCHEMLPVLQDLKREGLVRSFGLTEWFFDDTVHAMAERAVTDGHWDYLLLGFNLLNQSARRKVLPGAAESGVAVAVMFAVRRALSDPVAAGRLIRALASRGDLDAHDLDLDDPLGFLLQDGDCASVVEAAYRYARHQSIGGIILTGTGNPHHLKQNLAAIAKGPLPDEHVSRLERIFGALDSLTGQEIVDDAGVIHKKHVPGKPKGH